jgi:hypothetical protein
MMTLVMGWYTAQIKFILAFPQADTRTIVFMEVPGHFEVQSSELTRNSQAPTGITNQMAISNDSKTSTD